MFPLLLKRPLYGFLVVFLAFFSCNKAEFSPNQKFDNNSPRDINQKNLLRIQAGPHDDTIRFVLTGDSQRAYDEAEPLVKKLNSMQGIDFVILDGDISDFGLLQEMEWVNNIYANLHVPYIGVIGNHDHAANGIAVFNRMYGRLNYSFVYDSVKFVCHNTNSREYAFNGRVPDLDWLRNEFQAQPDIKGFVAVCHVPPFSDDFDQNLKEDYGKILESPGKLLAILSAHIDRHGVYYPFHDSIPCITTNSVEAREFVLIEIVNGKLSSKVITY